MTGSKATCLVCGTGDLLHFLDLPKMPIYCNVLYPSPTEAREAPRGDLALVVCRTCGHVFNTAFDPRRMAYTDRYENSLHFSPRFREYAEDLARELVERHDLHGRKIVEIASGQGDFLRLLCRLGGNRGVGFDPSYRETSFCTDSSLGEGGTSDEGGKAVRIVKDYFGVNYERVAADFLCCRQALEHIRDPVGFLVGVRQAIIDAIPTSEDTRRTTVFFEVPNSLFHLRDGGIWDFIYEHVSYFCDRSLITCFTRAGFTVQRTWETFGGQFLCIEAALVTGGNTVGLHSKMSSPALLVDYASRLGNTLRTLVSGWRGRLAELRRQEQRAVIWGAGSKGVTLLNLLEAGEQIAYVIDINPAKQGMFTSGTGHPVVSPDIIATAPPDLVICMNPQYHEEIVKMIEERSLMIKVVPV